MHDGVEAIVLLKGRGFTAYERRELRNIRRFAGREKRICYCVIHAPGEIRII